MSFPQALPQEAEVVVIGAGLAGAATACSLREAGLRPVVLERFPGPAHEASGRSAGMIREHAEDPAVARLTQAGAAWHRSEGADHFRPTGSVLLGLGDEDVTSWVPWARGRGRAFPGDGTCDVEGLLRRFLGGLVIRWGVTVHDCVSEAGALRVQTDVGDIHAPVVVNAAGAWAGELGGIALQPRRRHLFRSATRPPGPCEPFVWDVVEGFYFRAWDDGLLICACDEELTAPGDNATSEAVALRVREKARRLQPPIADLPLVDAWAGQRTFAPDGRFVVGWDPTRDGLFWVAGLGGHGVTASPAVGRLSADAIRGVLEGTELEPFDPARLRAKPHAS